MFGVDRTAGVPDEVAASRALEVWLLMAGKAGWQVAVLEAKSTARGVIGAVDVEGIEYSVHVGPRKWLLGIDASSSQPVQRPVLAHAVWVEPVVHEGVLPPDP